MFSNRSFSSIALATVTPSFVILGPPYGCSIITLRPCARRRAAAGDGGGGGGARAAGVWGAAQHSAQRAAAPHLRAERDLHGVRELVHATQNRITAVDAEAHVLGGVSARDGLENLRAG
jgi:hypothetical protein